MGKKAETTYNELKLERSKNVANAGEHFASFLTYTNPAYKAEWFHRLIARKCQDLLEGKIKNLMVFVPPQHGKELSDNTLVPTPKGFVKHGDLKVGDIVFNAEGNPVRVLALSNKVQSEYVVSFADGSQFECHGNHDWVVYRRTERKYMLMSTSHLARLKLDSGERGKRGHRYLYQVQEASVVEYPKQTLPIEPYTFGAWLGDGLHISGLLFIGNGDTEIVGEVGKHYDIHRNYGSSVNVERFRVEGLTPLLHKAGVFGNKHIPQVYKLSSVEDRTRLIAGVIDTDGYVYQKNGRVVISNCNKRLVDDICDVLRSLGQNPVVCSAEPTTSSSGVKGKQKCYQIGFNPTIHFPTRVARKKITRTTKPRKRSIVSIEKRDNLGWGNCIQVEGGVYLVGRTYIPTHNSEIISRAFPAWALGRNPDLKIVGTSYSADLAKQFSRSIQRIIDSQAYREVFKNTYLNGSKDKTSVRGYIRNVDMFECVGHKGFYKAVGVGGGLTGTPVDIAIIDDPIKDAQEAYSTVVRERVWDWYNTVLTTRLHNRSRQLFIMTRWHDDDLAGRILKAEAEKWEVLSLPALCEEAGDGFSQEEIERYRYTHRNVGDALWESRHSKEKLLAQQARAPREFAALYQQHPTIEGGNIVKREWFRTISRGDFEFLRYREPVHFYLDTAYREKNAKRDNDPSGIVAACRIKNDIYIVDALKMYKEMPDLLRFLPEYMSAHGATSESKLNVEPKANGVSVVQMLRSETDLNVCETPPPKDDKSVRLRVVSPRIECGRVVLVEGAWNEAFLTEVCGFPNQPHDEWVDVLGYAINDLYEDDPDIDYNSIGKGFFGI